MPMSFLDSIETRLENIGENIVNVPLDLLDGFLGGSDEVIKSTTTKVPQIFDTGLDVAQETATTIKKNAPTFENDLFSDVEQIGGAVASGATKTLDGIGSFAEGIGDVSEFLPFIVGGIAIVYIMNRN